jgi:uncharacterized membrane-anchored protein
MTVTTGARGQARLVLDVFLEEGFGIVQLGGERLVAHFLDHDHRGVLVQRLVDGDHGPSSSGS